MNYFKNTTKYIALLVFFAALFKPSVVFSYTSYSYEPTNSYSYTPSTSYSYEPTNSYSYTTSNSYSYTPSTSYSYEPVNSYSYTPSNSYSYEPTNSYSYTPSNSYSYEPNSYSYTSTNSYSYVPTNSYSYESSDSYVSEINDYYVVTDTYWTGYSPYYYGGYYGYGGYDYDYDYDIPTYTYDYGDYYVGSTGASPSLNYSSGGVYVAYGDYNFDYDYGDRDPDRDDDLRVTCEISDSTISEGDRVTIEVDIDGGNRPYRIRWSDDARDIDDFDLRDDRQTVRIDDEGTYRLRVTVEDDDGNEETDTCTIRVRDEDDDINVLSTTDGELAGLSSIYLNQVPYTGPEDTLKVLGFISLVLVWSGAIAYYLLKDRKKKQFSNRIQAFKEMNKQRVNI